MFERKRVSIKLEAIGSPINSCLDGKLFTAIGFRDGKTYRTKEFKEGTKAFEYFVSLLEKEWPKKIVVDKIGNGKYAGYDFENMET